MAKSADEKRRTFRELHREGFFVLPNPWDVGSARRLAALGFEALASTSSGAAAALGRDDYALTLDEVLAHLSELAVATDLPLNADFESGFGQTSEEVAANVLKAVGTGVSGLSVEDRLGQGLFNRELALERVRAARRAIDASGKDVMLVARTEGYLVNRPDLEETIARMVAMAEAGAECLYAPGLARIDDVARLVEAVAPKPVNVLLWPGLSIQALRSVGVRRVSTGGSLAGTAYRAAEAAASKLLEEACAA